MIATIQGKVIVRESAAGYAIIAIAGIGYKVFVPQNILNRIGDDVFLHTSLIVREDSLSLYGFFTAMERDLFETLLKISGVGPRVAVAILGTLSVENLHSAVVNERVEVLTRVPGIGKKTAQKILLELKDKLSIGLDAMPAAVFEDVNSDLLDTLIALGYSVVEAQMAIQALPPDAPPDIEERVRLALQYFM